MGDFRIKRKEKISRSDAKDLIIATAAYGDHHVSLRELGISDTTQIPTFFQALGIDFEKLVDQCRDPKASVPFFGNLLRSRWTLTKGSVAIVNSVTGEEVERVDGPGEFSLSTYQSHFEDAFDSYNKAIDETSHKDFLAAVTSGMSSIEAFLAQRVEVWNKANPEDQLIDSKKNKVSLDDKIDKWIPKMSGGIKINKGIKNWQNFKILRGIRDRTAHPKSTVISVSHKDLATNLNRFRSGIAGTLIQLHMSFRIRIPLEIIRCLFGPDVELVECEKSDATAS